MDDGKNETLSRGQLHPTLSPDLHHQKEQSPTVVPQRPENTSHTLVQLSFTCFIKGFICLDYRILSFLFLWSGNLQKTVLFTNSREH